MGIERLRLREVDGVVCSRSATTTGLGSRLGSDRPSSVPVVRSVERGRARTNEVSAAASSASVRRVLVVSSSVVVVVACAWCVLDGEGYHERKARPWLLGGRRRDSVTAVRWRSRNSRHDSGVCGAGWSVNVVVCVSIFSLAFSLGFQFKWYVPNIVYRCGRTPRVVCMCVCKYALFAPRVRASSC